MNYLGSSKIRISKFYSTEKFKFMRMFAPTKISRYTVLASVAILAPIFVSYGCGKLSVGLKNQRIPTILVSFTHGCTWGVAILLYRLCKLYLCDFIYAILFLLAYFHKYRAQINKRLSGITLTHLYSITLACLWNKVIPKGLAVKK